MTQEERCMWDRIIDSFRRQEESIDPRDSFATVGVF